MSKPNYLELMFLQMKGMGFYKEYETYQDYRIGKGIDLAPSEKKEDFRETLTPKEREEYDYMFGTESG
jgi:hypothetical protein